MPLSYRKTPGSTRRWRPVQLAAFVAFCLLAAGLATGFSAALASPSASPPAGKVTLRVGWVNEPDNLNPFIGYSTSSYLIYHLNYDQLTGCKASDVTPDADLAESWTHDASGNVWTFKLRPGVKWQDGVNFTADVVFTYRYIIDNQLSAFTSYTSGTEKGQHPRHGGAHRARAHLEQGQPQGGGDVLPQRAAHHRHRSLPGG